MFESLKPVAIDPILGLMMAFKADERAEKIDLGVGIYQDDRGRTPVMEVLCMRPGTAARRKDMSNFSWTVLVTSVSFFDHSNACSVGRVSV